MWKAGKEEKNTGKSLLTSSFPHKSSDNLTGLPGLRTWRSVYVFVLGVFAAYVVLLLVLTRHYS